MNLMCPNPASINPLLAGGFVLTIDKLPEISFFAQESAIPGMSLDPTSQATPFSNIKYTGDKINWSTFNVQFIIDASMVNYLAVDKWLRGLGFPESNEEFINFSKQWKDRQHGISEQAIESSDGTLFVIGGNQKPLKAIRFQNLIPTSLSGFSVKANYTDPEPITANVSFDYTLYNIL